MTSVEQKLQVALTVLLGELEVNKLQNKIHKYVSVLFFFVPAIIVIVMKLFYEVAAVFTTLKLLPGLIIQWDTKQFQQYFRELEEKIAINQRKYYLNEQVPLIFNYAKKKKITKYFTATNPTLFLKCS